MRPIGINQRLCGRVNLHLSDLCRLLITFHYICKVIIANPEQGAITTCNCSSLPHILLYDEEHLYKELRCSIYCLRKRLPRTALLKGPVNEVDDICSAAAFSMKASDSCQYWEIHRGVSRIWHHCGRHLVYSFYCHAMVFAWLCRRSSLWGDPDCKPRTR